MRKDKINCLQFAAMMSVILIASFVGIGMFAIIKSAGVDAYLSIIIAGIIGIFIVLTFFVMFDYEPDLPISLKFKKVFGPYLGTIFNVITMIIILSMGISAMFNLTTFITSQFLKNTPPLIVGLSFSFLIIYVNFKGIETLSRTCLILLSICITLYVISLFGLIPQFEMSNIKPFLEYGLERPFVGAIYNLLFNLLPIYLLLVIPKNSIVNKEKYRKYIWFFYVLSIIIKLALVLVTIGVLGIHLASIYQYPEYIVVKRASLFNFIDRIENIISIQWLFGLFFNISFVVYYISNSIKTFNKSKFLPIIITTMILVGSELFFKNNTVFNDYTYTKVPYIRIILLIIYVLLFVGIIFKKKFSKKNN